MATISISKELEEKLREFKRKNESYEDVIRRMYDITSKHLLLTYLYDESDSISIDEAIKKIKQNTKVRGKLILPRN